MNHLNKFLLVLFLPIFTYAKSIESIARSFGRKAMEIGLIIAIGAVIVHGIGILVGKQDAGKKLIVALIAIGIIASAPEVVRWITGIAR